MQVTVYPSVAQGCVMAPPSKSMAHRLLICAGLSSDESIVRNVAFSQDITATLGCLEALGAKCVISGNTVYIKGVSPEKSDGIRKLYCKECGSTLRFFIPICMLSDSETILSGSETLFSRPLSVYEKISEDYNLTFEKDKSSVLVKGPLKSGHYTVEGNISSQFISGLLFALPHLSGDSVIEILPPVESKPYIAMTLQALRTFGIEIVQNDNLLFIKGGQQFKASDVTVEGDYSNSAFLDAFNLFDGNVSLTGLSENSLQGDRVYKELFARLKTSFCEADISDCPDLAPILFTTAAMLNGAKFTGTKRLRIKESDRVGSMQAELMKCGAEFEVSEDAVVIKKCRLYPPKELLFGHNDHRVVMALSVLLSRLGGTIDGAQAVNKSFPDYFKILKKLNIKVDEYGMDT